MSEFMVRGLLRARASTEGLLALASVYGATARVVSTARFKRDEPTSHVAFHANDDGETPFGNGATLFEVALSASDSTSDELCYVQVDRVVSVTSDARYDDLLRDVLVLLLCPVTHDRLSLRKVGHVAWRFYNGRQ